MTDALLQQLAELAGIAVDWIDTNGRAQRVSDAALRQVLAGLGHPADDAQQISASLHALKVAHDARHLPPLFTVDVEQALDLSAYFPAASPCRVQEEDGTERQLQLDAHSAFPAGLPIGYHRVEIGDRHFTLAVAPTRCFSLQDALNTPTPRCWGISAQLYSLRRTGDGGFGDCLALEQLARSAAERGADALAISPLHAMFASDTRRYSPYSPSSRLWLNSVYALSLIHI